MKTIILTGYDDGMKEVGDLTRIVMRSYANFHNFDFRCCREYHDRMHPSFQKIDQILAGLESFDRVIWLDADVVITNFYKTPHFCMEGINVSEDWGRPYVNGIKLPRTRHFSMGISVSTKRAIPVLEWVLEQKHWYWKIDLEQAALKDGATEHEWIRNLVHIHPNKWMNSVDSALSDVIDPETGRLMHEDNPVRYPWEPGDWLCHLTGRPNADRMKQIDKYLLTGRF